MQPPPLRQRVNEEWPQVLPVTARTADPVGSADVQLGAGRGSNPNA